MYKGNSKNMQGRAARIRMKDMPSGNLSPEQLTDAREERRLLCLRKNDISLRINALKATIGVKPKVQHREVKGNVTHTKEYREWGVLAEEMTQIDARINELPKVRTVRLGTLMMEILQQNYPDVYSACRMAAINKARQEPILLEELS